MTPHSTSEIFLNLLLSQFRNFVIVPSTALRNKSNAFHVLLIRMTLAFGALHRELTSRASELTI